jgi:hypothetical protein
MRFKYKRINILYPILSLVMGIGALICGFALMSEKGAEARFVEVFMFISFFWISFLAVLGFFNQTDIEIDDDGLSRILCGHVWQRMLWDDVRLISAFPVSRGNGSTQRAFNIFPIVNPTPRLSPSGKMMFNDKIENVSRLVELLNHHAQQHGIKIEVRDTVLGERKQVAKLS